MELEKKPATSHPASALCSLRTAARPAGPPAREQRVQRAAPASCWATTEQKAPLTAHLLLLNAAINIFLQIFPSLALKGYCLPNCGTLTFFASTVTT